MKHIAFTIDDKFVRFCAVTMASILENNNPHDITFHIVSEHLSKHSRDFRAKLSSSHQISIAFYSVTEEKIRNYKIRWEKQRISIVTFYRCFLSSILPADIAKVLYLDSDILVLAPLDELWNTSLENIAVAAVADDLKINLKHCNRLKYDLSYNYFNAGVLLLNLDYWRKYHIEDKCNEYYLAHQDQIVYNDQDLLNGLLYDQKVLVDLKWNVQENAYRLPKQEGEEFSSYQKNAILHPFILHYSSRKPWQYHCMHPLRHLFFQYQALTPWKGENVLNHFGSRLRRFIHTLPYRLRLKKEKYIALKGLK